MTQGRPKLDWVRVDRFVVDPDYQRQIREEGTASIKRIAEKFDWRLVGALSGSPVLPEQVKRLGCRNDAIAILDGQHRWEGARRRGDVAELPTLVVKTASVAEQAALFLSLNRDRVAVQPIQQFWSAVVANEPMAVAIKRVCDSAGVTIAKVQTGTHPPLITSAIGTIRTAIARYGEDKALVALKCMVDAYPKAAGAFSGALMGAVFQMVGSGVPPARLAAILSTKDPKAIVVESRVARHQASAKESLATTTERILRGELGATVGAEIAARPAPAPAPATPRRQRLPSRPLSATKPRVADERAEIEKHIATKGVIKLPPAIAAPSGEVAVAPEVAAFHRKRHEDMNAAALEEAKRRAAPATQHFNNRGHRRKS